ncbi:MAG TPA: argininosuccinate lyase, partial [Synergistaceae bacterium]|nr:argininosuccinate lyase [Synergistaceae bacterium]
MWKGRFKENTAEVVQKFTESLDLDWRMYAEDIRGSKGHVKMLVKIGLLSPEEGEGLCRGLDQVEEEIRSGKLEPSVELEDVHMNIESRLIEILGPLGAKLHMGRSRNDQVATTVRLYLRSRLARLGIALGDLLEVLLENAERHLEKVVPGYTHLQQAQPISMGHYWMGHFAALRRDTRRLLFALESLDECPLGAGALAGSTLPLDRKYSSEILGFREPTENSLDTVGHRDYQTDYHYFASLFTIHCSRMAEDLIVYSSQEFRWIELPDAFCTGSSMMPQKKNADVLEIVRGKTGQVIGHFMDLLISLKGLPSTFNRDLQEDKRSLWRSLETLEAILEVLPPLLSRVEIREKEARRAFEGGTIL